MNTVEKLINVLARNLGYTVVLVAAIILFSIFSDGLIPGLITAASALIGYACIVQLGREYKKSGAKKSPAVKSTKKSTRK